MYLIALLPPLPPPPSPTPWSQAVKLTSVKTQLPYRFYDLPYCEPDPEDAKHTPENLGEILRGDRIVNTPYEVG